MIQTALMSLAVKKDSIWRSAFLTNFGPSNFVTALAVPGDFHLQSSIHYIAFIVSVDSSFRS